jgi:hypothetical protein
VLSRESTQLGWRPSVGASNLTVEAADAPEARGKGDLIDRKPRFVEQLLREVHATRERDVERRGAQVPQEESPQMSGGDAQPLGQLFNAGDFSVPYPFSLVPRLNHPRPCPPDHALADETQRARDEPRRAEPRGRAGRRFGPAA